MPSPVLPCTFWLTATEVGWLTTLVLFDIKSCDFFPAVCYLSGVNLLIFISEQHPCAIQSAYEPSHATHDHEVWSHRREAYVNKEPVEYPALSLGTLT